jgi:valyl-tRNA synthetase
MVKELAKAYEPAQVEDKLYGRWIENKNFHADPKSSKEPFSIVIPPPNVTGMLTMGHVLNNTIQDIMIRHARLNQKEALWIPGLDHAGLATQSAVEKNLKKTTGQTRHDFGREAFIKEIWNWNDKHGGIIISQLKKLGCSCDWDRQRYTQDADYSKQVLEVFIDLYKKGYVYRGKRMVNWCPASLTAISDEEVIPKAQKSTMYYMKYEIVEKPGEFLQIATTRPETLMGDTAVAVNPKDPRFKDLIGKHCWRPFPRKEITIIGDESVDIEFGTGALKVTPAHDKTDFEIGQRHNLEVIDVLTPAGKINCPEVPELHGLDRFEARKKAAEMLKELDLLLKEEPYQNNVGYSERGDVPIEPRLSEQWFLKYPKTEEAYQHWLENIQDWCLSRQVWWGHRIPIWYKGDEIKAQLESPGSDWTQDEDVLDTWASSWLWAHATMDKDVFKKFYPTNLLVTGPDIIFLWVARMIIAGLEFKPSGTDDDKANIPFKHVYFTGIIRDKTGRKMSKSLGNSPDPLDLIAKFGADGLRFGIMRVAPQGQDIKFDEKQVEEGRNFCNKLWNACRFRTMQGPINPKADPYRAGLKLTPFAQDLLQKLDATITKVDELYAKYEFSAIANEIYAYVWDEFCSRFIEVAKADFQDTNSPTREGTLETIDYVISNVLRLMHPYTPFLTEELWLELGFSEETIQFQAWPKPASKATYSDAKRAQQVYETSEIARSLRGEFNIQSGKKTLFKLLANENGKSLNENEIKALSALSNASEIEIVSSAVAKTPMMVSPLGDLYLPLEGLIDPEKEKVRLEKEIAETQISIEREEKKLNNPKMMESAPAEKVAEWRDLHAQAKEKLEKLRSQMQTLAEL